MLKASELHYRRDRRGASPAGKERLSVFRPEQEEVFRILSLPFFNRYSDKTQVYFLMENDDITHRGHHVYKVSFLSRLIAAALNLNETLCESISLAHDIGHPPFAHSGERFLDRIMPGKAGIHFNHALQSIRVVEKIFPLGLSLETLCGIACHSGFLFDEKGRIENASFEHNLDSFDGFDNFISQCYEEGPKLIKSAIAPSFEGRVVRICDIISYIFRDREDALLIGYDFKFDNEEKSLDGERKFVQDVIRQSQSKGCVCMSRKAIETLQVLRKENSELIYSSSDFNNIEQSVIYPLFENLFMRFLDDLRKEDRSSVIFKHHIDYIEGFRKNSPACRPNGPYYRIDSEADYFLIASDFLSSMSDDYFISICRLYFPNIAKKLALTGYFEGFNPNKRRKTTAILTPPLFDI